MNNYNSVEAQYPTEYGLWDDDIESRIDDAINAADENDLYNDLLEQLEDDFDAAHEEEIQALHDELASLNIAMAVVELENLDVHERNDSLATELEAAYLRMDTLATEDIQLREELQEKNRYVMELHARVRSLEGQADALNDHIYELTMTS